MNKLDSLKEKRNKKSNMMKIKPYIFCLSLADNKVHSIYDIEKDTIISRFSSPLTNNIFKIYILKSENKILYIGTTKSSIKNRLRNGLNANGKKGYYGYKWKTYKTVMLYVFCFADFDKIKIENIESELAFIVRKSTGRWPESQNEIHFNNNFIPTGQLIAKKIYNQLSKTGKKKNNNEYFYERIND